MLCEARFVDGLSDREIRELFRQARDADYQALADEVRALGAALEAPAAAEQRTEGGAPARAAQDPAWPGDRRDRLLRRQTGARSVDGLLGGARGHARRGRAGGSEGRRRQGHGRGASEGARANWVTRKGVHVDRIA